MSASFHAAMRDSNTSMKLFTSSAVYFAIVFGAGFVFGTVRVMWLVPTVGVRVAELTELPLMLAVVFFAARWVNRRLALAGVAVGAALFAIAFRLSLGWLYRFVYHADNVVDGITSLPRWLRFVVPVAGAALAGLIARLRNAPSQNVSNVMEAVALGHVQLSMRATASRVASSWAAIAGDPNPTNRYTRKRENEAICGLLSRPATAGQRRRRRCHAKAAATKRSSTPCTRSRAARKSPRSVAGSASASRRSTAGRSSSPGWACQELRELRSLRHENSKLKQVVADLTLDRHILQEIVRKKL